MPQERVVPRTLEPYRILFPLGIAFATMGAAVWPLQAWGWMPYPGTTHRALMMLGFEQAFVLGFLLTAMPSFTHGERCRPWELAVAAVSLAGFGVATLLGHAVAAGVAALAAIAIAPVALVRRVVRARARPPEEFAFVAFALSAGLAGAGLRLLVACHVQGMPAPPFADRLTSLGMVLPLVLGLGSLLVPTFAGFRNPLVIPGVAGAHETRGRRVLYLVLVALLAGSFVADLANHSRWGHALRAVPAWTLILWVWRPWRPGRSGASAWALRIAGPLTAFGVTLAALVPSWEVAALHVTFIGGFALLTLAIGTRVIVSHGQRPLSLEAAALSPWVLTAMGLALALRLCADAVPASRSTWLAASALAWLGAWGLWGVHVVPVLFPFLRGGPSPAPR